MPPLPPCSILQNPGKTAVLLVLPLMAGLGTGENISVFYQFYSISEVKKRANIGSFRRPIGCAKNELVAILETDWLYCAWQSRQEKILRMSVSRLGELFVVAREGEHAHFLRIHISNKPKVANWF